MKLSRIKKWKRDALEECHTLQRSNQPLVPKERLIQQCNKTAMLAYILEASHIPKVGGSNERNEEDKSS